MNNIEIQDIKNYHKSQNTRCEKFISCADSVFRYVLVIEYLGGSFAGSQVQPGQRTVQSEIESVLNVLTGHDVKTVFAGRTDRGVHAKGQVVHFDLPFEIDTYKFIHSMNSVLPADISIISIKQTERDFHSQRSAQYRWYKYTINNRQQRSSWFNNALHISQELDIDNMNKALSYLIGKHDFSSFKSSNSSNPAKECIFHRAICLKDAGIIYIDLIADRFLYNMVRIIVGTVICIGKGSFPPEYMLEVLEAKDRTKAGPTARPEGLVLMSVGYNNKYKINDELNKEAIKNENLLCKAS
ncbi:MAG: tRNA pseudouridine(38-40) synthase TruA [Candidatus Gastranaerophilales bacterium]|nr:tRNA pseudouridine(38-40) synthase TruA [Candidatus Gastranaerophilales bacterium]